MTEETTLDALRSNAMLCRDNEKAAFVAAQWKQAKGQQPDVTCGCGLELPLRFAFRCLYCGEWYCQSCAEQHFGKTREQHNAEKVGADSRRERGERGLDTDINKRHNAKLSGAPKS